MRNALGTKGRSSGAGTGQWMNAKSHQD
jgi:hypothetical protein